MTPRHQRSIHIRIDSLPALPATVSRVMAVTADPECGISDLMRAIQPDQSMCSALLQLANSAFFGLPSQVGSLDRALVVLGQEEVKNIVIGKALFAAFPKMSGSNREKLGLFWEHSFTCGLAAKIIADHFHLSGNEFFIAGLIHDIGRLAMLMEFPHDYPLLQELADPNHFHNPGQEQLQFATSHDVVGRQLAEHWRLPGQLVAAIGYHHNPEVAPAHRRYPLIMQVADILSLLYCCADISGPWDAEKIFADFLPETQPLWARHGLYWQSGEPGNWFSALQEQREKKEDILRIFVAS